MPDSIPAPKRTHNPRLKMSTLPRLLLVAAMAQALAWAAAPNILFIAIDDLND